MVNYLEILRLQHLGYSQRSMESATGSSRHTIREFIRRAKDNHISWPLPEDVTNGVIEELLYSERKRGASSWWKADYAQIHSELARSGVTLTLLWSEYCAGCHQEKETPYMYTQFCEKYRNWARVTKATMRITRKPGEVMEVDWAGTTIPYFDSVTGVASAAYLFVAALPCSGFTYAEACLDMKSENWQLCHSHAYTYFGGATRLLIPDNLKTGVTKNTRYETILNTSYQELAQHYGTAIVPARVRKPQDKGAVEGSVKYATTWITAALRNQKCFTLEEVQSAVSAKLEDLNDRPYQKRSGSRRLAFLEEEKEFLIPLPKEDYKPTQWKQATVGNDYLISDGKNKYSVPFNLIGEQVQIRLTRDMVEVYLKGGRVASHQRKGVWQRDPIVNPNHMPDQHREYLKYNSDDFTRWSRQIGTNTEKVVSYFLAAGTVPEQGYKFCASLTKLAERYGDRKLELACQQMIAYGTTPNIRLLTNLLKQKKQSANKPAETPKENHAITRGPSYYRKGGGEQ